MTTTAPIIFTDAGQNGLQPNGMVGKVRKYAMIPNAQQTWQNSDIIDSLDDANKSVVIELINSLNEEYFVEDYIFTVPNNGWDGSVPIPSDSIGLDLRDVWASKDGVNPGQVISWGSCTRVNPNQISFNYPQVFFTWSNGQGPRYYITNNVVQFILPQGQSSVNLGVSYVKLRYFKKPSTLCSRTYCAVVTGNDGLNTITLDLTNTGLAYATGMTFDFIEPIQPFIFDGAGVTPTQVTVFATYQTLYFAGGVPTGIAIGDLCCPTGMAPVLQYMPEEAINVLCQAVVVRYQDAQGNDTALQRANQQLETYVAQLQRLLTPKVADQTKTMVSSDDLFSNNALVTYGGYVNGAGY